MTEERPKDAPKGSDRHRGEREYAPDEWIPWPPADAADYLEGPPPRYEGEQRAEEESPDRETDRSSGPGD